MINLVFIHLFSEFNCLFVLLKNHFHYLAGEFLVFIVYLIPLKLLNWIFLGEFPFISLKNLAYLSKCSYFLVNLIRPSLYNSFLSSLPTLNIFPLQSKI